MSDGHKPECYGRIFPDVLHFDADRPVGRDLRKLNSGVGEPLR